MFKNKVIQMKVVKEDVSTVEEGTYRRAPSAIVNDALEILFFGTAAIVGGYVLADTFRQVAIFTAMQKITPRAPRVIAEIAEIPENAS